jgi:hypothetical protein
LAGWATCVLAGRGNYLLAGGGTCLLRPVGINAKVSRKCGGKDYG